MPSRTWYLFIYQIPPKPLYLRAKIRQRLMRAGAVPLKKSAYAVPAEERLLEPLRAIARETEEGGGEAYICEARFVDDTTEQELLGRFGEERRRDYEALMKDVRRARSGAEAARRLRARYDELRGIDFFGTPHSKEVAAAIEDLETHAGVEQLSGGTMRPRLRGAVWITREDIGIDRMASAWLIRRYIDPNARFRFVEPGTVPKISEMSFDMPGAIFTHEKDKCTFQVIAARVKI
ncbi:MAG TPA: chromate resistance protein ChrB domain-containing protein, partial [Thermoanaerobaculia bacterium]|nr:chromate resistance protein ChrB domain-containing protein [Thermoanaerobaculia bacterium]